MSAVEMNIIGRGKSAAVYTITFEGENQSEFEKFVNKFKDHAQLNKDYKFILLAIEKIMERGALERYFRPEGKMSDNVCALPIETNKLRLYCIRMSDKILIAGNGGVKKSATYNEDETLNGYVISLQQFENLLKVAIKNGDVTIEELELGIDGKMF